MLNIKVKGYSQSFLSLEHPSLASKQRQMYERVWDEADYVVPPAENGAFFVTTNVIITPNQTLGYCPEVITFVCICSSRSINSFQDPGDLTQSICETEDPVTKVSLDCLEGRNLIKSKILILYSMTILSLIMERYKPKLLFKYD